MDVVLREGVGELHGCGAERRDVRIEVDMSVHVCCGRGGTR